MKNLKRTLPFVRPYAWVAFFMLVTSFLPAAAELLVPYALRTVIDDGITAGNMAVILRGSGLMMAAALVGAISTLAQGYCRAQISQGLAYDLREKLFAQIQAFSFANLDQLQTGQLMTRLSSDVDMLRLFFSAGIALLLRALIMLVGSVVLMVRIDWQLTLVMAVLLPLASLVIWFILRLVQPLFTIVQQKLGALNTIVQENLAGVQVVKAFVRERYEIGRFAKFNHDYRDENIHVGRLMAIALPALTILTNLGIVAVLWFGGQDAITGRLTVGELVAFNNYLMIGMAPLLLLSNILNMVSRAESSSERIWEILDIEPAIRVADDPHTAAELQGHIRFQDVAFHYNGGSSDTLNGTGRTGGEDVLRNLSFTIEPGQRVALLGATGSGKSSLVNLIPRFYDAHHGSIEIDGVAVRDWDPEALRSRIGMVLQEATIFSGTIRDNIAYGRLGASLDDVVSAAKAAQAHDFIMRLPDGYESAVEERGANLSGGQKQRLAIARALLIAPDILIFDDSTSAVDVETEYEIQQAIDERLQDTTTLIVAQRISSVLNADQIFVLNRGQIAAHGTHHELLESSPIYQEIYHSQMGNRQLES